MSTAPALPADRIWEALQERDAPQLRFRSAMITSTALHTGSLVVMLLAPLLLPRPQIFEFTPVNVVQLQAPEPAPAPPVVEEPVEATEEQPEPEELAPPPPDDVPEDLEAQRRAEEEAEARRREEERRRLEEEAERRRLAEEARRRREAEEAERLRQAEEEARRQPQKAAREEARPQQTEEITQQAQRGQVGMQLGEEVTAAEATLLQFWINRVLTNIGNNWDPQVRPAGSREIVAVIHFRVDRNGGIIVGPEVRSGSGTRRYDDAAMRAVRAGQPFPPLPQAYRGSTLAINLAFRQ